MSNSKRLSKRMSSSSLSSTQRTIAGSPTLGSMAAAAAGAQPPPIASSRGGAVVGSGAAAAMSMSAADVRGGLELLRGQVAALQAENDGLKHGRAALERERAQDLRYMRALLGRSMMRHHAQSFKMRRLIIHLHARVLDLAAVLNREQKVCEARDNRVASVQEGDGETEAAAEAIANEQRAHFLASLTRLRPIRVGQALRENMERLIESVGESVARCPRYRSELDYQFGRLIELKQQLLSSQDERQQADQRCSELEAQMQTLAEQTEQFRAKNEKLARDMHQTIDVEKKRRLRDNAAYIKARTSLYKQILADKDSPLHPANLARVGKSGTNIATQMQHKRSSLNGSSGGNSGAAYAATDGGGGDADAMAAGHGLNANRQAAAQQDDLERRHAPEHSDTNDTAGEDAEQYQSQAYEDEGGTANESDPAVVADPSDAVIQSDPVDPSLSHPADGADTFGRSEDVGGYDLAERSNRSRASVEIEVDEKEEMQPAAASEPVLPPIAPSQSHSQSHSRSRSHLNASRSLNPSSSAPSLNRLPFPNPFSLSPLRAKPSAAYAAAQRAEAAYGSSNEYLRHLAHEYTHHRFVQMNYATSTGSAAAAAAAGSVAGSSSQAEAASSGGGGTRPQFAKKESMLHPSPSLSFSSAQRIFAQRVGVGGNPGAHSPSNSVAHAPPWIPNFAAPALAHSSDTSPSYTHSSSLPRVLGALDDVRSQAAFHASERRVHEGALAPRPANIASPSIAPMASGSSAGAGTGAGTRKSKSHSAHHSSVSPSGHSGAGAGGRSSSNGRSASDWTDSLPAHDSDASAASVSKSAGSTGHGGSGAGGGGGSSGGGGASKAPRVPMSRRPAPSSVSPPAHSRSSKHTAPVEHIDAPTHMRIIPASPRREAGLF